jgi:catechol 2,3-dioxygenase
LTLTTALHPEARIGHVRLTVSNLARALRICRDMPGLEVTEGCGSGAVFFSAGGYHCHIALNIRAG